MCVHQSLCELRKGQESKDTHWKCSFCVSSCRTNQHLLLVSVHMALMLA